MNRRDALISLFALGSATFAAEAQQAGKVRRIGVLRAAPDDAVFRANFDPLRDALRKLGFVEGIDLAFEYRVAYGTADDLLARANELVRAKVDVILAIATAGVSAAAKATATVPIVAVDLESDPVAQKLASSLARPGGNITGLFLDFPELSGKWLEFLRSAMPKLARAALLYDPTIGPALLKGADAAAASMKIDLIRLEARSPAEFEGAFQSAAKQKAEALLALSSPVFASARKEIAGLSVKYRLPSIMPFPQFADDGGLIAYGPHLSSMFHQAGGIVAKVLRGARPAEIPIERPTRFELAVNLKTARTFGIAVPRSLLVRADRVVE